LLIYKCSLNDLFLPPQLQISIRRFSDPKPAAPPPSKKPAKKGSGGGGSKDNSGTGGAGGGNTSTKSSGSVGSGDASASAKKKKKRSKKKKTVLSLVEELESDSSDDDIDLTALKHSAEGSSNINSVSGNRNDAASKVVANEYHNNHLGKLKLMHALGLPFHVCLFPPIKMKP
jgi:hypothetical protein